MKKTTVFFLVGLFMTILLAVVLMVVEVADGVTKTGMINLLPLTLLFALGIIALVFCLGWHSGTGKPFEISYLMRHSTFVVQAIVDCGVSYYFVLEKTNGKIFLVKAKKDGSTANLRVGLYVKYDGTTLVPIAEKLKISQ
ncbi:MAG: hypothetical protein WCT08_04110 [Patescibacteria group bacterium]|jgi:hypothetical protein